MGRRGSSGPEITTVLWGIPTRIQWSSLPDHQNNKIEYINLELVACLSSPSAIPSLGSPAGVTLAQSPGADKDNIGPAEISYEGEKLNDMKHLDPTKEIFFWSSKCLAVFHVERSARAGVVLGRRDVSIRTVHRVWKIQKWKWVPPFSGEGMVSDACA